MKDATIYLLAKITDGKFCSFSYGTDNKKFNSLGKDFNLQKGQWIGAKMGMFCTRPMLKNDGGRVDIDWFRVEK